LLSKGIRRQIKDEIVKKEISLGKKEIVKLHFQGLKASSFSNIWDNKTSILLSKESKGRVCSINTFYTIVMDKSGSFQ
jgi:hypothetical protein